MNFQPHSFDEFGQDQARWMRDCGNATLDWLTQAANLNRATTRAALDLALPRDSGDLAGEEAATLAMAEYLDRTAQIANRAMDQFARIWLAQFENGMTCASALWGLAPPEPAGRERSNVTRVDFQERRTGIDRRYARSVMPPGGA